jgi:lysophospholipase L1-like esterase
VRHNPDVVTVLVGLNDIGTTSPEISTRGYYRTVKRMLRRIDVRYYAAVYRRIIAMLRERTHARIVLCTLTTLGENPNDPIQPYIDSYCNVIRALAVQEGLALVDLRRAFWAAITNDPRKVKPYTIWRPIFDGFSIGYRGETYTSIGMRRGYQLLCDGAHLSDVGADLVAREMLPVVEQALNSV